MACSLFAGCVMAEEANQKNKGAEVTTREGFYASTEEAQKHLDQTVADHLKFTREKLTMVEMNYHFGAATKKELVNFIAQVKSDGFSQCDAMCIDKNEEPEAGEPKFWWVPGKKIKPEGALLIEEMKRYQSLADSSKIHFGGITADDRQGD